MSEPASNVFHLSGMLEHEKAGYAGLDAISEPHAGPWAVGVLRDGMLVGALTAMRGTGGIYHEPGDTETLAALAAVTIQKSKQGVLSLLSGHESQVGALLPLINAAGVGPPDYCYFQTLQPASLQAPHNVPSFHSPRIGTVSDMERLIDFYELGFYSLARLPSRAAWRNRLSEQFAYRTLYLIEDMQGRVAAAALSSAGARGVAMLGGVATRAEYRGRGLSALCVGALCSHLFRNGTRIISLFYLEDNQAAGRVYEKLGFKDTGHWLLAPLGLGGAFAPLFNLRTR